MATVATQHLPVGAVVYTTDVMGDDFGIPIVDPNHRMRDRCVRTVRNSVKCRGGHVVWFTDGTKTNPLHGRAVWVLVQPLES